MNNTILNLDFISPNHKYALLRPIEKLFLDNCARFLQPDSTILEVGTFLGGGSAILAHANPNISIVSIDQYDNYKWNPNQIKLINEVSNNTQDHRTLELVIELNKQYTNIMFLNGTSPYDFTNWDRPIDIYIEDGTHRGDNLKDNIDFWITKIKPGGYIFLHDYRPYLNIKHNLRFIDVEKHVLRIQHEYNFKFENFYGDYAVLKNI